MNNTRQNICTLEDRNSIWVLFATVLKYTILTLDIDRKKLIDLDSGFWELRTRAVIKVRMAVLTL